MRKLKTIDQSVSDYHRNIQNNIKFLKASKNMRWADVTKRIFLSNYNIKMSFIKKFSYGQITSINLEKIIIISNLFGQSWYDMVANDLSEGRTIKKASTWLDD
jgi:hypothetical protein